MCKEIDTLHWRCDNLQRMLIDLANRVGHEDMADNMLKFHNKSADEIKETRKEDK